MQQKDFRDSVKMFRWAQGKKTHAHTQEIINEKSWNKPHFVNNLKLEWHTAGYMHMWTVVFSACNINRTSSAALKWNANGIIQPFTWNQERNNLFARLNHDAA